MSFSATSWAYEQRCGNGPAKAVLAYLAKCASVSTGDCWPSMDDIVIKTEFDPRTVGKSISLLIEKGYVTKERRFADNGRCMSSLYRLAVVSLEEDEAAPAEVAAPTPTKMQGWEVEGTPYPHKNAGVGFPPEIEGEGDKYAGDTPANMQGKRKEERKQETLISTDSSTDLLGSPMEGVARVQNAPAPSPQLAEAVQAFWNVEAAPAGLPKVLELNKKRRAQIKQRVSEHGLAGLQEAIRKVAKSDFCCGDNKQKWRANFDFVLGPENILKVLEGNYDNRTAEPKFRDALDGLDPNKLTGFYKLAYRLRAGQLDAEAGMPELEGIGHG